MKRPWEYARHSWAGAAAWVALLVMGVGVLAWVAAREADRAQRTAERLMQDYASFVADRFADASAERYRRLVGLSGMDVQRDRPSSLSVLRGHVHAARGSVLPSPTQSEVRYFFLYDPASRRLDVAGNISVEERRDLEARLSARRTACGRNQVVPFGRLAAITNDARDVQWSGIAETDDRGALRRIYGLALDPHRAAESFLVPLVAPERECECLIKSLLPGGLAALPDALRSVSFVLRDASGATIFRSKTVYDNTSRVRRELPSDMPFAGWTVDVAVDPEAVRALLPYGGQNASWLLVALLGALVVGCGALAVNSVRRNAHLAELRQSFIANVSHELKAPLSRIRLLNELMIDAGRTDPERSARYRRVIDRECRRLGFLVDNVLDFARQEKAARRPDKTPVDLRALAEETLESFRAACAETPLSLSARLEAVPRVLGDPLALSQVLVNLLDNAVKYSQDNSPIDVSLSSRDSHVELAVADRGIGIPPAETGRIFEAFYRADSVQDRIPGSGLGLALVHRAVEDHGGTVRVESVVGQGSTFVVSFPMMSSEAMP
jgi:signal transduction histidine kinase